MSRDVLAAFQPGEIGFIANPYPAFELLDEPEWKLTYIIRGLKSLPVRV